MSRYAADHMSLPQTKIFQPVWNKGTKYIPMDKDKVTKSTFILHDDILTKCRDKRQLKLDK